MTALPDTYLVCSGVSDSSSQKEEGDGQGQKQNHQSHVQANGTPANHNTSKHPQQGN